jgi:signal transduction histidine kinase
MLDTLAILVNGLTLALAFGLLLIVLWYDVRKPLHQFFGLFLLLVLVWNAGALLTQAALVVTLDEPLVRIAVVTMELGFSGASVALFALATVLVGAQTRRFRLLVFLTLFVVLIYRALVSLGSTEVAADGSVQLLNYQAQPLMLAFYLIFDGMTLYLIWRGRRKIRTQEIVTGISVFVIGQGLSFLNPDLQAFALSTIVCSLAALSTSFAILRAEILTPLSERMSQVEAIHRVSLAITSQIALDTVLEQIAVQAAKWLRAEAVGIWLIRDDKLELTTVYNLPEQFVRRQLTVGQGIISEVVRSRQAMRLEDYKRDWGGLPDLPVARDTFGSVIAAPLTYGQEAIGALMVIAARDGRLFDRDDVHLLELLGAQAAVAISNSTLFADQQALAQQILKDVNQLKELDRMKNEMVRMTSHDLKNPLQAAMANLDLLREDLPPTINADAAKSMDVIERQLQRMNRIIRGILDLERARAGTLKFEAVEPARLVAETEEELRHFVDEGRIRFEVDVVENLPLIACDSEQLKRALINLVENAFKFTPAGGVVRLCACTGDDGRVRFVVEDTGVGIPAEAQPFVFDRFYRANQSGTEHVSGSGLGLSLVNTVIEKHHGKLWFTSKAGQGTAFFVEVPQA